MKKKIFSIVAAILILTSALCALVACGQKSDGEKTNDNISRRTDAYFAGESETFAVSVEKGRREKTFIADGKTVDVVDFCCITVTPLKSNDYKSVSFVIKADDKTLSGEIATSDFGEFSTDITLDFNPKTVTVTAGEEVCDIEMSNILEGALSSLDAVNVAKDAFKDKIAKEHEDGKAEREIYVKLITGDRVNYYYYVSFIGDGLDYWAMLIDPKTGDIISKR